VIIVGATCQGEHKVRPCGSEITANSFHQSAIRALRIKRRRMPVPAILNSPSNPKLPPPPPPLSSFDGGVGVAGVVGVVGVVGVAGVGVIGVEGVVACVLVAILFDGSLSTSSAETSARLTRFADAPTLIVTRVCSLAFTVRSPIAQVTTFPACVH